MSRRSLKTSIRIFRAFLFAGLLVGAGCDRKDDSATKTTPRPVLAAGSGVVRGIVKFSGKAPEMNEIGGPCCFGSDPVMDESVLVNENGTLRNVVVYVKAGPNVESAPGSAGPAALDQKDCRYVPHVVAVRTGQAVDVTSQDPTMHNVHVQSTANPAVNFSEPNVGATHRLVFAIPEMIHVECEVHPWMSAYICVLDHPFFAVTGEDGSFQIGRLPSGTYTLVAWHERYGSIEQQFTVDGVKPADVEFEYKKR